MIYSDSYSRLEKMPLNECMKNSKQTDVKQSATRRLGCTSAQKKMWYESTNI